MIARLARPMERKGVSTKAYFVQRISKDVRSRAVGMTLQIPVGDSLVRVSIGGNAFDQPNECEAQRVRRSAAQWPSGENDVLSLAEQAVDENEFVWRPSNRLDSPIGDGMLIIEQRQVWRITCFCPSSKSNSHHALAECPLERNKPGDAGASTENKWLRVLPATETQRPIQNYLKGWHGDRRRGFHRLGDKALRQAVVVAEMVQGNVETSCRKWRAFQGIFAAQIPRKIHGAHGNIFREEDCEEKAIRRVWQGGKPRK